MTTEKIKEQDGNFTKLNQQNIRQNHDVGFLFCPGCGHIVQDGSPNSICPICQYRFCPSCND
ncbi:MAG: hypothetical protein GY845_08740 [Planctomycetes bacterium]|nr:hypothetical protein [Planctomycetota bacterium]